MAPGHIKPTRLGAGPLLHQSLEGSFKIDDEPRPDRQPADAGEDDVTDCDDKDLKAWPGVRDLNPETLVQRGKK